MRSTAFLALAPVALASAIPVSNEAASLSFDKRQEASFSIQSGQVLQSDFYAGLAGINQQLYQATQKPEQWKKCSPLNISVRKEWSAFSTNEKKSYISAVKCMATLPAKTPQSVCPGCKNRYDDFVATHMQQTFSIHVTGNFLPWHRYYVWAYEQTLRNECGYKGAHPYHNWPRWSNDPASSPALDGSATSMSGNGVSGCTNQTFTGIPTNDQPSIKVPHGSGGGCVASGPFKDWSVNIGPGFTQHQCTPPNPITDFTSPQFGLGYNPRCLKRDISSWVSSQSTNDQQVVNLLNSPDMKTFWADLQGGAVPFQNGFFGLHTGGHFTIGGDPGSDFAASPGDPWFFFHHSQVDRVWWTWQNLNPASRTNAIYGTRVILDPTAPATELTDTISLGYAFAANVTIADVMSTMGGPLCYTYL